MSPPSQAPPTWVDKALQVGSVVLALEIVGFSLGPAPEEPTLEISDMVIHAIAYFSQTLAVLLAWVGRPGRYTQPFQTAVSATLVIVAGGLFIELMQSLVSRETEALDALANTLGAGMGLALWTLLARPARTR
jgi:VanZ family protein